MDRLSSGRSASSLSRLSPSSARSSSSRASPPPCSTASRCRSWSLACCFWHGCTRAAWPPPCSPTQAISGSSSSSSSPWPKCASATTSTAFGCSPSCWRPPASQQSWGAWQEGHSSRAFPPARPRPISPWLSSWWASSSPTAPRRPTFDTFTKTRRPLPRRGRALVESA